MFLRLKIASRLTLLILLGTSAILAIVSIPDYYAEVERPASVTVDYVDTEGRQQTIEADGLLATCLQHEIDHLNGVLFIDHISKLKRDMVIKKFNKMARTRAPASI